MDSTQILVSNGCGFCTEIHVHFPSANGVYELACHYLSNVVTYCVS